MLICPETQKVTVMIGRQKAIFLSLDSGPLFVEKEENTPIDFLMEGRRLISLITQ